VRGANCHHSYKCKICTATGVKQGSSNGNELTGWSGLTTAGEMCSSGYLYDENLGYNYNFKTYRGCCACWAGKFLDIAILDSSKVDGDKHDYEACEACVSGLYQDERGKSSCKKCAAGTYASGTGTKSQSECKICAISTYSDPGSISCDYSSTTCPVGTHASGTAACEPCAKGKYNDEIGLSSCKDCANIAGMPKAYNNQTGQVTCKNCADAALIVTLDRSRCRDPSQDLLLSQEEQQTVGSCGDLGTGWGKITSKDECNAAAAKKGWDDDFAATTSVSSIFPVGCSAGSSTKNLYYNSASSSSEPCTTDRMCLCTKAGPVCAAGKFQDEDGQTSCKDCPLGSYMEQTGQSYCQACPDGQSTKEVGSETCDTCPKGNYKSTDDGNPCKTCTTDKYSEVDAPVTPDDNFCKSCPTGRFIESHLDSVDNHDALSDCEFCPVGFEFNVNYPDGSGTDSQCPICPSGKYQDSNNTASVACTVCDDGKYNPSVGDDYSKEEATDHCGVETKFDAADDCTTCPVGQSSADDRKSCDGAVAQYLVDVPPPDMNPPEGSSFTFEIQLTDSITAGKEVQVTVKSTSSTTCTVPDGSDTLTFTTKAPKNFVVNMVDDDIDQGGTPSKCELTHEIVESTYRDSNFLVSSSPTAFDFSLLMMIKLIFL
jgi:hypothetical protein